VLSSSLALIAPADLTDSVSEEKGSGSGLSFCSGGGFGDTAGGCGVEGIAGVAAGAASSLPSSACSSGCKARQPTIKRKPFVQSSYAFHIHPLRRTRRRRRPLLYRFENRCRLVFTITPFLHDLTYAPNTRASIRPTSLYLAPKDKYSHLQRCPQIDSKCRKTCQQRRTYGQCSCRHTQASVPNDIEAPLEQLSSTHLFAMPARSSSSALVKISMAKSSQISCHEHPGAI
jgi:hypothetical protein